MDSRLTYNPAISQNSLAGLPDELKQHIASFVLAREVRHMSQLTFGLHKITNKNDLWVYFYERDFGPLVVRDNAKAQYIAMWLYNQADEHTRPDIAQILFLKLNQFLNTDANKAKPWTLYFRGVMSFYGNGLPMDVEIGMQLLLASVEANGYKAMHALTHILMGSNDRDRPELLEQIGDVRLQKFSPHLIDAYKKGFKQAAMSIAYLHKDGLGITKDITAAEMWLKLALDAGNVKAVEELVNLKISAESSIDEIIIYLDELITLHSKSEKIIAEIHYQKGCRYLADRNDEASAAAIKTAAKTNNTKALHHLGRQQFQQAEAAHPMHVGPYIQNAYGYFNKGFELHDRTATISLFNLSIGYFRVIGFDPARIIDKYKIAFFEGNSVCAILINSFYSDHPKHAPEESERIWWMQTAASCGCRKALQELTELANAKSPSVYAQIALGIIYSFGVLHSEEAHANEELANLYLSAAQNANPVAIAKYLQTGTAKKIICDEVRDLLVAYTKKLSPHTSPRNL